MPRHILPQEADQTLKKADRPYPFRKNYLSRYRADLLLVIEESREKRRNVAKGTKGIKGMRKSLTVAEGQKSLKKTAESGRRPPGDGRREDPLMANGSKYH
jgi:hypothetical protein